uniref:Uncharacterized protein n=1 Tax=Leersia perrieri TaxID=77586 RepID=A0A0D9VQ37_9ORYZ
MGDHFLLDILIERSNWMDLFVRNPQVTTHFVPERCTFLQQWPGTLSTASLSIPLVLPKPDATDASCWPASVILANRAYIADYNNMNTATTQSRDGHKVQATFCLAEAPTISYFYAYCSNPSLSKLDFEALLERRVRLSFFEFTSTCLSP